MNVSNIEEISTVLNPKIGKFLIYYLPDTDIMAGDKTKKSGRKDSKLETKEKSPMSNKSKSSNNHTSSRKDKSCKAIVDKSKAITNRSNNVNDKSKDKSFLLKNSSHFDIAETKNLPSSNKSDVKGKSQLQSTNLETSQSLNSVKSVCENISRIMIEKECYVSIEKLPQKYIQLYCSDNNQEIIERYQKPAEKKLEKKEKSPMSNKSKSSSNHTSIRKYKNCKDVIHKSKVVDKYKDIVDISKAIGNRSNNIVDKSKDKSFLLKNSSHFDIAETKNLPSSNKSDVKEKSQLQSSNLETSQSLNSVKSVRENISRIMIEKECYVSIEKLPQKYIKLYCSDNNQEITEEYQKPNEIVVDEKELINLNVEYEDIFKLKINTFIKDFIGFSIEETQKSIGHKFTIQQLKLIVSNSE